MSDPPAPDRPTGNRLLAALPADDYARLLPHLETISLPFKQILHAPDAPIAHVYFLTEGVVSLVHFSAEGTAVEVATIGNEGMVGLPVFLGAESTPSQALAQVPGAALRMPAAVFRRAVPPGSPLHALLQRYTHALMVQMAQGVACNRLHPIAARAARWLLQTRDRVRTDAFPLTQEFLAQMLAVRRSSVSEVAATLAEDGCIGYSRGTITVLDRDRLEANSCTCYRVIRDAVDAAFPPHPEPAP
jgi:CRP-like cAMP-binding protein